MQTNIANIELENIHAYKKELANKYVVPAMGIMSLIFHIWYFRPETQVYVLWAYTIPSIFANFYLSKPRDFRVFGRIINSRDERLDTIRWCYNIVILDIPAVIIMRPSQAVLAMVWFMVLWAARSDMSGNRFANFVTALGIICYCGLSSHLGGLDFIPIFLNMIITIIAFALVDGFWVNEILGKRLKDSENDTLQVKLDSLRKDAFLGSNTAIVAHEIRNPMTILKNMANNPALVKPELAQRSVQKIEDIINLVLSLKNEQSRSITLGRVVMDLDLITRKVNFEKSSVSLELPEDNHELEFVERAGSLFFILSNLIKNAKEAVEAHRDSGSGWVKVKVEEVNHAQFLISVADNGPGLSKHKIKKIMNRELTSNKSSGHGIGLKFVVKEIENNGYKLHIDSSQLGTKFVLTIPRINVVANNSRD